MGRIPYLEHIAWGRAPWAPASENDWDLAAQSAVPSAGRAPEPVPGQREEDAQQYDENLRPINPRGQKLAKALRRAANDILAVVGVVERADDDGDVNEDGESLSDFEAEHVAPVGLLTTCVAAVSETWVVNFTNRLLAFPPPPGSSFVEVIEQDTSYLGAWSFVLGGLASRSVAALIKPAFLAPHVTYYTLRVVIANVASSRRRQWFISLVPAISAGFQFLFTVAQFPLRLHSTLQGLGLVPAAKLFPSLASLIPFSPASLIRFGATPLPVLALFLCGPLRQAIRNNFALPFVTFIIDPEINDVSTPSTARPGLRPTRTASPSRRAPNASSTQTRPTNTHSSSSGSDDATPPSPTQPRVHISESEAPDGTTHQEVSIEFEESVETQVVDLAPSTTTTRSPRPNTRAPPRHQRSSPLVPLPYATLKTLFAAHITNIVMLPLDAFVLPRLASWYMRATPYGVYVLGVRAQTPLFDHAAPLLSWANGRAYGGFVAKLFACYMLQEVVMLSVWTLHTNYVTWVGRTVFGWGKESDTEGR